VGVWFVLVVVIWLLGWLLVLWMVDVVDGLWFRLTPLLWWFRGGMYVKNLCYL